MSTPQGWRTFFTFAKKVALIIAIEMKLMKIFITNLIV